MAKYYEVYSAKTGEFLAEGTSGECAEQLGIRRGTFNGAVRDGSGKYRIVDVSDEVEDEATERTKLAKVIRDWDETVEKLRGLLGVRRGEG